MLPRDQRFVRSVLNGTYWPVVIFYLLVAVMWGALGIAKFSLGAALAGDAGISLRDAISKPEAVAGAPNVELAAAAGMRLTEAVITWLVALMFLFLPCLHVVFFPRLRRIFRELPADRARSAA
jgi:hypothetical protein